MTHFALKMTSLGNSIFTLRNNFKLSILTAATTLIQDIHQIFSLKMNRFQFIQCNNHDIKLYIRCCLQ